MPTPTTITAHPAALEVALADAIKAAKRDDPLAPVTVLVGSTLLRPYLQRRLATLLGGHANVAFVTAGELALKLGEPALIAAGRTPMPPLAARILAGEVARDTTGYFAPVAHTTGFTSALHRLIRELTQAGISGGAFATVAPNLPGTTAKHQSLAELVMAYESKREGWYGVDDCLLAADPKQLDVRLLVLHGVWDLTGGMQRALAVIAETTPTLVLLPTAASDAAATGLTNIRGWCESIGAQPAAAPTDDKPTSALRHVQDTLFVTPLDPTPPDPDGTVRIVSAPDPTREVRAAARACLEWAAAGIPFHRMAIASRHADTYRPLVDAIFREAGIPAYLHEGTPLGELPLGRRVLAILDLLETDVERRAIIDVLSDADLPKETRERYPGYSATRWDTISRAAGIVGGRPQWRERLAQQAHDAQVRADEDTEGRKPWLKDDVERIQSLARFVEDFATASDELPKQASFAEHLDATEALLTTYVARVEPVITALRSLARLDGITPTLSFERFRDIVRSAIEGMRSDDVLDRRVGAFGRRGVNVLDVNSLRHLQFDGVVLLGLVERSWPSPVRQDPLLLDRERAALSDPLGLPLPLRTLGGDPEALQFVLAVQSATTHLQVSYPRADRAGGRSQLPSSFLRAVASAATGAQVSAEGLDHLGAPLVRRERAAQAGAPDGQQPMSSAERRRTLLENPDTADVGRALLQQDARFTRAAELDRARASRELTTFDGCLGEEGVAALAEHWSLTRPMPPTALEKYAGCGMQFFLSRVLGVRTDDEPEALLTVDALTKGSLVHTTLERFLVELGDHDYPRTAKRAEHLQRLLAICTEECDAIEGRGLTGYPMLWEQERRRIAEDVERWYDAEVQRGRDLPRRSYELRVGPKRRDEDDKNPASTDEPLTIAVDGHELRFQGRIDRVEWDPTSGRFRVIDYKTGRVWKRNGDIEGGEALQLPLYVRAAAHALDLDPADGDGEYFYVTRDGGFVRITFTQDDLAEQQEWVDDVLGTLIGSVSAGVFPARPRELRNCDRCTFDSLCDAGRMHQKKRKADDPRAVALDRLREKRS
ncbi:exonuclease [Paraconexibacter sp. AEG42_29]|uniref:Exonuclease n=1 Tax=Paraconexibacter sp. AEG42_29 TaxID=2997339 RepID=A0AAU7B1V4_9ACTN